MFQPGDKVIYGGSGVCLVESIGKPPFAGKGEQRLYYTLRPVTGTEIIYAPVDTTVYMRPVISSVRAKELIESMPRLPAEECSGTGIPQLRQHYEEVFHTHDCENYVKMLKGIYCKSQRAKKLGQTDQRYKKRAEDMLHGELAAALDMDVAEIPCYIRSVLEREED